MDALAVVTIAMECRAACRLDVAFGSVDVRAMQFNHFNHRSAVVMFNNIVGVRIVCLTKCRD